MNRQLIVTRHTTGLTLSAYYKGQRVLRWHRSRHLDFYPRVAELTALAVFAELCAMAGLQAIRDRQASRNRLKAWLAEQRAMRNAPTPDVVPIETTEEKRAAELERRGWPTFDEGMALVYQAMILKGQSHAESIQSSLNAPA